jgi:hypothetical protein
MSETVERTASITGSHVCRSVPRAEPTETVGAFVIG